ncbi:MAG: proline dehydrogenase family protein [Nitriliruptorales bacterium]|nr:proline dehydrogenase family protein [Nitriliruptorales bacterium]
MLRRALIAASESGRLREIAENAGAARNVAMRFVAGETLEDALRVARQLNMLGMRVTLDHLGESVTDEQVARQHADTSLEILDAIDERELDGSISVKPTALGIDISRELCEDLIGRICKRAADVGTHVTIDMEGSDHTQDTVDLVRSLRERGHDNVGCAVQSYLHRTYDDVRLLTGLGASLRLCKGAYSEPEEIAYQERIEIDRNFVRCADYVLQGDTYGRFATHDDRLIARLQHLAGERGVPKDRYEFQMLYGVREPLQRQLVADGYDLRVYVPFGSEWYPYFVRRIAERPANLTFFLRALLGNLRD